MALIKSTENSESIANPVGCNGWGLEGWERYKNTERSKKRIPGEINIREDSSTIGKRHAGLTLVTGLALRILFLSCGRKVIAASETQPDGRALRSRKEIRNRGMGCDNVLQNWELPHSPSPCRLNLHLPTIKFSALKGSLLQTCQIML